MLAKSFSEARPFGQNFPNNSPERYGSTAVFFEWRPKYWSETNKYLPSVLHSNIGACRACPTCNERFASTSWKELHDASRRSRGLRHGDRGPLSVWRNANQVRDCIGHHHFLV